MNNIIIIGVSSDIGRELAVRYIRDGDIVIGTYRTGTYRTVPPNNSLYITHCDVNDRWSVEGFTGYVRGHIVSWDVFICSVADMRPVSSFFGSNFEEWAQSIDTNFTNQLRVLHALYPYRNMDMANVVFFAGMGTNGPVVNQSAICASKIALIKMCELINHENRGINAFTIGPGFVRTKIHRQTLESGDRSASYYKAKEFIESEAEGTSYGDIYNHINWCISVGKLAAGGRNFSTVHDRWGDDRLTTELYNDVDMYKLRRYRNT